MEDLAELSSFSSERQVKAHSALTLFSYECEWNGCEAVLNCWKHLQKHYYLHSQWVQKADKNSRICGFRYCHLDKARPVTLASLRDHIDRVHLSRLHVPCPVSDCSDFEIPDKIYHHFLDNHTHQLHHDHMAVASKSCPYPPKQVPKTLPVLPNRQAYIHELIPLTQGKITNGENQDRDLYPKHHVTLWSCFQYDERPDEKEELPSMKSHDLDFAPLKRPQLDSKSTPWPIFTIKARPISQPNRIGLSAPPTKPPSTIPDISEVPPTFLYKAFKEYMEIKQIT